MSDALLDPFALDPTPLQLECDSTARAFTNCIAPSMCHLNRIDGIPKYENETFHSLMPFEISFNEHVNGWILHLQVSLISHFGLVIHLISPGASFECCSNRKIYV